MIQHHLIASALSSRHNSYFNDDGLVLLEWKSTLKLKGVMAGYIVMPYS